MSAIAIYLLVCAVDYARFYKLEALDESKLTNIEKEFATVVRTESESRSRIAEQIRALQNRPQFKKQLANARRAIRKNTE